MEKYDILFKEKIVVKADKLLELGYTYKDIQNLESLEAIKRIKNGYYVKGGKKEPDQVKLVLDLFPDGVFTMETAMFFHGYITRLPYYWSIAISKNTSKSRFKLEYPLVHPFYTEPSELEYGVMSRRINGRMLYLYDKDRLICEVLKYEDKMERDDFKTAISSYVNDKRKNTQNLLEYAQRRRVSKKVHMVIGPWL